MRGLASLFSIPIIVISQLFGTSLWFSVNGVWNFIATNFGFSNATLGYLTLMVQAGFIAGTLTLAFTALPDRIKCSYIFCVASLLGAFFNAIFVLCTKNIAIILLLRFLTGFTLAGIYPIGMKLIISWSEKHSGMALSWLLGTLTLGTALPHLMKGVTPALPWQSTLMISSFLAGIGGLLILYLGDGPYLPESKVKVRLNDGLKGLKIKEVRLIAGGYFGHCWELYAFWMLTPFLVEHEIKRMALAHSYILWFSFFIISLGSLGCIVGGFLSKRFGSFYIAYLPLWGSGIICFFFPLLDGLSPIILIIMLFLWGMLVVADSPQFSALLATTTPKNIVGSSLAVVNSIGFALTIPSIWITSNLWKSFGVWVTWVLLISPIYGLLSLKKYSLWNNDITTL